MITHPAPLSTGCTPTFDMGDPAGFLLARLCRLLSIRPYTELDFDAAQLLHRAIYSTYLDCLEHGLEAEARAMLAGTYRPSPDEPTHIHIQRRK